MNTMMNDSQNSRMINGLKGLLAVALVAYVGLLARNTNQQYNFIGKTLHDRDTFTVNGEGKVSAKPDLVKVSLGVTTDAITVKEAQKTNTDHMNAIISALKSMDIAAKDIQTANYSVYPKIDWTNGKQRILGYTVSQNVEVKVRDLDKVGDVLGKAGELGANQVGGLDFTVDDPKVLQDQARDIAIDDAKKKANILASKLGLQVVKVVTFSENGGGQPYPRPMEYSAMMKADSAGSVAPQIEAGSLDVNANVSVTFEVR